MPFLTDPEGEDPQILLLRQYRYAADGYLYEIPAGRLDPGETPADCAARELREETGCTAEAIEPLITMLTTPGFTDERIHLFMATGLTPWRGGARGGRVRRRDRDAAVRGLELIQRGEISDGKTALGNPLRGRIQDGLSARRQRCRALTRSPIGRKPDAPIACQKWTLDRGILASCTEKRTIECPADEKRAEAELA